MEIVDSVPDAAKPHVKHKVHPATLLIQLFKAHDERWVKEVYSTPNAAASAVTRFSKLALADGLSLQIRRDGATVYMRLARYVTR